MNTYLFIAACVLSIIVVIVYTFVSVAIHKRDLCRKSPYYFCDTDWLCCKPGNNNCDVAAGGPSTQGNEANAYFLTDQLYGSNKSSNPSGNKIAPCRAEDPDSNTKTYYEACIEPVKLITNYYNNKNEGVPAAAMDCLYTTTCGDSTTFNNVFKTISPELANLTVGQCCYQPIDPTNNNSGGQIIGQYYPAKTIGNTINGSWNSASLYAGQYFPNTQGYNFPPTKQDTTNNSCFNTLFGAPASVTRTEPYRYTGCPGS